MALDVDERRIRGTWFKHARPGTGPLPYRNPAPDNRWQRGTFVDAVYLADTPETVWAEWYRHLAESGLPPAAMLPVELWRWDVDIRLADLSTEDRLARVGLPLPRPGRAGWPAYQAVGEELWRAGSAGLIAPSAAMPAGLVLCLLRTESELRGITPNPAPQRITDAPIPPTGMLT